MERRTWLAGDLTVDDALQRVTRSSEPIELPRLSFDLLIALLESAPAYVSLDQLMNRVWKGLVVSPETVTQRVKLLRDALGDDSKQPRYVEGLRGRGYRWMTAVSLGVAEATPPPSPDSSPPPAPRFNRRSLWTAAALAVAGLAAIWGLTLERDARPVDPAQSRVARTVAVLPFATLAGDLNTDAVGPGIAETVLDQLARVRGLTVIARETSFRIAAEPAGGSSIGSRLGAAYIVAGSVQRVGDLLRVNVRLLDDASGTQLWSRQFDRDYADAFALQDDIAGEVARALESRISGLDPALPRPRPSSDLQAWLAYLRGRALIGRFTVAGAEAAATEFQRALQRDPSFAPAYAALYDARMQSADLRKLPLEEARRQNQSLLDAAIRLDGDAGAAHLALAMWLDGDTARRDAEFRRGLELDPSNSRGLTAYSEFLDQQNRGDEASAMLQRALLIDPLSPRAHFRTAQRNFDNVGSAIELQAMKVLELDPEFYPALQRYSKYQWMQHGRFAQAIAVIERAIALDPQNPWARHTAAAFYLDIGDPAAAQAVADGTPVSAASTRPLRAAYRGDWRVAGEAAQKPASFLFGAAERWGVTSALRDYALRTGTSARIASDIRARYRLSQDGPWMLSPFNFREALIVAQLMLAQGQREPGEQRIGEVLRWIDANERFGPVYNERTRAQALMLLRRPDEALLALAKSFDAMDYTHWWYTVERDPTWDTVRTDARFLKIAERARRHAQQEREELQRIHSSVERVAG